MNKKAPNKVRNLKLNISINADEQAVLIELSEYYELSKIETLMRGLVALKKIKDNEVKNQNDMFNEKEKLL